MTRRHFPFTAFALVLAALAAGLLGGCGQRAAQPKAPKDAGASFEQMTPADKSSQIATSFPLQVPVIAGSVIRGESQGDSAWVYQLVVPGTVQQVHDWYVSQYGYAEWLVASDAEREITVQKGSAQSRLQFEAADTANEARTQVTASVGVGTPVLGTK